MKIIGMSQNRLNQQLVVALMVISTVALFCYSFSAFIDYRITALFLLTAVSVLAMFYGLLVVLFAAVLSSLILNFLFLHPLYTFHITNSEDLLLLLMFLIIALLNGVLTAKIRKIENINRQIETQENTQKFYNAILNSLSHEFRTPIATIIAAIDVLKFEGTHFSEVDKVNLYEEVETAAIRLDSLVGNLLTVNRLESGVLQLKYDWCDLEDLVYHLIEKMNCPKTHTIQIFKSENLPLFQLDSVLIFEVLFNLLKNAINYTPSGTIIQIHLNCVEDCCVIQVVDNGNGIMEADLLKVFDKFYSAKTATGGMGLGLSIAKGFVEAHNGALLLESQYGKGATFTIKIPTRITYLNNLNHE